MHRTSLPWVMVVLFVLSAALPAQTPSPRLERQGRQGDFAWVVETTTDGSRRGGWVKAETPLEQVDRSLLRPLPALLPGEAPAVHPTAAASSGAPATVQGRPTIFITPTEDNFEVFLSAAMMKKEVPVTITTKAEGAELVLKASAVEIQQQSTGSKIARCLFAYCAGMEDRGLTSVQLLRGDTVAWSYSVNKGRGQKNRQSLAEAVAKHLKSEYFER